MSHQNPNLRTLINRRFILFAPAIPMNLSVSAVSQLKTEEQCIEEMERWQKEQSERGVKTEILMESTYVEPWKRPTPPAPAGPSCGFC